MQRIAFYLTSFEGGGAERITAIIGSEMARRGHPVLMIVDRPTGPNRDLLDPNVTVQVLQGGNRQHIAALRRTLRDWRADVVFASLGLCPIIATLAQIGNGGAWRTVNCYHNPYDSKTSLGVRVSWWGAAVLSRLTHASIGVSQDVAAQLTTPFRAARAKTFAVPNPVDLDWVAAHKSAPMPANFPTQRPYILSVGRLVPQKGYPDLIAAFARIASQIGEDLVILGEGPDEAALRAQIAAAGLTGRIHLAGYDPNPFPIFAKARLFALASHWEGFGNVLVEALACGTPIVATNCPGGPKDILDHGRFGALVPVKSPDALAAAMLHSLQTPPETATLMARADDFSLPRITDRYLAVAFGAGEGERHV